MAQAKVGQISGAMRIVYVVVQVVAHLLLPVVGLLLLRRARKEPAHLRHLSHRFGFGAVGPKGAVWIYAASLGETRAASPLIRRLIAAGRPVLLTHLSPAGLEEGWRLFPDEPLVTHRYMPLDLFWAVRIFLWRARPALGVVLEIEIWPAMLIEARAMGVPIVMANGNLLEESIRGQTGFRRYLMGLYGLFTHVFTRTEAYRDRYVRVGVDPARISVVGELKYDQWIDPAHVAMGRALRADWGGGPVFMIASSVKDEEPALTAMVQSLISRVPGLRVVWVPRSAQRFEAVAEAMKMIGLSVMRRSDLDEAMRGIRADVQVLVGNSMGEMNAYYPMADLVFVGASLVDMGGHNIMEPMALGRPVVMGPSIYGIAFAAEPAGRMGAFLSLPDAEAVADCVAVLFANAAALDQMSKAAETFTRTQSGAADRTFAGLVDLLPS